MPELTPSTRELARRIGVTETALRKAEGNGRIAREPDGQWDVEKTRRRMVETADPIRSPLAQGGGSSTGMSSDATPFARLKVAELALKVEARRLALDEEKSRLLDAAAANAAIDEIAGAMRDALLNWPARVSGLIAADLGVGPQPSHRTRTRSAFTSRRCIRQLAGCRGSRSRGTGRQHRASRRTSRHSATRCRRSNWPISPRRRSAPT